MSKRLEFSDIKNRFASKGFTLLEKEYINDKTMMRFRCKCGNINACLIHSLSRKKSGCKQCIWESRKHSKEFIKQFFENAGCKLISEYSHALEPVSYICNCGRESKIRFADFQRGKRCSGCAGERRSGPNNGFWNPDRELVELTRVIGYRSRTQLKSMFQRMNLQKRTNTKTYVGYSIEDLVNHIRVHQNWNNVKDDEWHIDHIFPVKAFIEHGIRDMKLICALDNIQPISKKDNLLKNCKYNRIEFREYLITKNVIVCWIDEKDVHLSL